MKSGELGVWSLEYNFSFLLYKQKAALLAQLRSKGPEDVGLLPGSVTHSQRRLAVRSRGPEDV